MLKVCQTEDHIAVAQGHLKCCPGHQSWGVSGLEWPPTFSVNPYTGFPLGLENLENLEKWEGIFQSGKSQGILNRLEKSGKIAKNTGKLREFEINII